MKLFPGDELFKLHDTYGLPMMMTMILLKERGMLVEWPSYFDATRKAGWSDRTAILRAKYAAIDSGQLLDYDALTP